MRAYQAHAQGASATAATPRAAALAFFERFPARRKCSVIEGKAEGRFFSVTYGRPSLGQWPASWKDVTRKTAAELPDEAAP